MKIDFRGLAWVGGAFRRGARLEIENGVITSVEPGEMHSGTTEEMILVPGFVDLHVHGGAGADFMDADPEASRKVCEFHLRNGTTSLAATTLSGTSDRIMRAVSGIRHGQNLGGAPAAEIAAIHFEGPFINPRFAGAQDPGAIRPANVHEVERWVSAAGDLPLMMTFAPEVPGAMALLERFRSRVIFSIGHSDATFAEATDAIRHGARHFTHLFNAMRPLHHREPGCVGAALSFPDVTAELIADGHHLHPTVLRIAEQALRGRAILVTDAMRACGMPPGSYKLYEHDVIVRDGAARLADGTLAGSVLTMIDAVKNMVELASIHLAEALPLATSHPASRLGLGHRKGRIAAGCDADLLVLNPRFEILSIWKNGVQL